MFIYELILFIRWMAGCRKPPTSYLPPRIYKYCILSLLRPNCTPRSLFPPISAIISVTCFYLPPCSTCGSSHYAFSFTIPISYLSFPYLIYAFLPCDLLFLDSPKFGASKLFQNLVSIYQSRVICAIWLEPSRKSQIWQKTKGLLRPKISVSICIASPTKPPVTKATYQESFL